MKLPLRILHLEDDPNDVTLVQSTLEAGGIPCTINCVQTRNDFVAALKLGGIDLILSDFSLPAFDGLSALKIAHARCPDVPFILVTGTLGEEVAVECIKQGITDYVLKEHLARLPLVVARALEERALRDARGFMVQALRQSEANSLFLFAHNPLPMWVFESETLQILQVNDAAVRHYGYDRMDFLQMTATDLHPAEEVPKLLAIFRDPNPVAQHAGQWRHRKKDGSVIDVEMFAESMEYSGRAAVLVVAQKSKS